MKRCLYELCRCPALPDASYCGDTCEWLDGGLLGRVEVRSAVPLKEQATVTPQCACGHSFCAEELTADATRLH
jgi:hypothetical protein